MKGNFVEMVQSPRKIDVVGWFYVFTTNTDNEQTYKRGIFGIRGFQKA